MRNPLALSSTRWRHALTGIAMLLGVGACSLGPCSLGHGTVAFADDTPAPSQAVDDQGVAVEGESSEGAGADAPKEDAEKSEDVSKAPGKHAASDERDNHDGHTAEGPGLLSANPGAAIWNLLIFLTVLTILGVFVWPQILAGLQAREAKIHADLHSAEDANRQAQAALAGYQKQLSDAQDQVRQMLAEARRDAEGVGAKIVEEAKADAQRQRERALSDIEAAKNVALGELAGQTSEMAIALARQVVGRELKASDHADLIQKSLERLPSRN